MFHLLYYIVNVENLFLVNFYISYQNFCFFFKGLDLLPECILLFCLMYGLISIFNDRDNSFLQYYRWLLFFIFILILLCFTPYSGYNETTLLFGFTLVNCWYTKASKIFILILTISVLYASKTRLVLNTKLYTLEFPLVIGFSVFFLLILTSTYDFFGIYLALEGLSLTLYVLAGILNYSIVSIEAAIKYFSLGAIASGVLLLGVSLLFGIVGSLDFLEIQLFLGSQDFNSLWEARFAVLLILFGFFFKLSAFPCHWWVADVYEGIWTPVTAFFAIVIKVGLFLFFFRVVYNVFFNFLFLLQPTFIFVSVGSMIVGTFGALKQVKIKRFIAYASISQVGFLMLGVASCSLGGFISSIIFLFLYALMSLAFFILILNIEHVVTKKNVIYLSEYYCFSLYNPSMAKYLAVVLFSMAGIPPLGGFICKLLVYISAIDAKLDTVVFFSLVLSLISTYYYLNFIHYIWFVKFNVLKLYYFKSDLILNFFLEDIIFFLVCFIVLSPLMVHVATNLAVSCLWPIYFY